MIAIFQPDLHAWGNDVVVAIEGSEMRKHVLAGAVLVLVAAVVQAAPLSANTRFVEKKARPPEQACQGQALASIARGWSNVMRGQFEIIVKDKRCLVFLQAPAVFEGKRTAWLIDGRTGDLLSEFYAPTSGGAWKDSDRGLCSYRGGKFPTADCTWSEYLDKIDQM